MAIEKTIPLKDASNLGIKAAEEILKNGGNELMEKIRNAIK
jgi:hypothetical protein